ncbi:hypothetical protein RCH09_001798 [Actimicrobium sp. GrIS 1.19]|uniref:DUF4397 domain-containing protein n=1 Tax=Actimicrobium sp. GrIS 1.19 TaxID=3071708 RepID=UPI002E072AE6|nr:hypothetical protein [Actimicrobium sp. GrIS 1.19]
MKPLSKWVVAIVAASIVAGCGGDSASNTQLRVIHASADAPNVDVLVGGTTVLTNVPYKTASGFLTIASGTTRVQVNPTGAATSVIDVSPALNRDRKYSAVAVGSAAAAAPAAQKISAVLVDDPGNAPASGNVKIRVVHGAPAVPAVDIYVTAPGATLPALPTIAALAYTGVAPASGQLALEVPAGNYEVRATLAGSRTVAFDSGQVALAANADLLMTAIPASGVAPVGLLVAPATGAAFVISDNRAALRVAHFAPNVPAVDVFLKAPGAANSADNRALQNVAFPANSGYLTVPSGTYDASVALTGTLAGVLDLNGAALAPNTSTSVAAIGLLGGSGAQALQLKAFADDRVPVAGKAKVRVLHLAPDAPAVDVVVLSGPGVIAATAVSNLAYPNATSASLQLVPGTYTLAVVPTGAATPILPSAAGVTVTLTDGQVATIAAIGCLNTSSGACIGGQPFALTVLADN